MYISFNGVMCFNDVYDLTYNLLNTIGLSINANGHIYDQDTKIVLDFHGSKLKATVNPNIPCFAGQGEVMFDILNNVRLVTTLLGYCIDKETAMNGFRSISNYLEENPETKQSALTIKMEDGSLRTTGYYENKCLKFINAIFLVYEDIVDLSNFDIKEE